MISVVIPVLNGAATIGEQLQALSEQRFDGEWEVVVSDNGSTDETVALARSFEARIPNIRIVDASRRRGPAAARNCGAREAAGDILAFCDADDIVAPGWLPAMARATANHDFVAGAFDFHSLSPSEPPGERPPLWAPTVGTFHWLKYGLGANMAVSRNAFRHVGGFTEELHAGEDLDLSWRLQMAGYPLHYEPEAVVHKRHRTTNLNRFRQHFDYGRHDVALFKRLHPLGMPRRPLHVQVRLLGWLILNVWRLLAGRRGRTTWLVGAGTALGRLVGSLRHRTLYL